MMNKSIMVSCPKCGEQIDVSDAIAHSVQEGRKAHDEEIMRAAIQQGREAAQAEVQAKDTVLKAAKQRELEALQEVQQLRDQQANVDVEVQRKLMNKLVEVEQAAMARADEKSFLKLAERDKKISDLMTALSEAQRKGDQGSQQLQGEVLEVNFQQQLENIFRRDKITGVPKGTLGADIIQHVMTAQGRSCGVILYENKRTKAWKDEWVTKLKGDMLNQGARVGVIVTETMPSDITTGFGQRDGDVWVSDLRSAMFLVAALRRQLEVVEIERGHREGAKTKMESLYDYITGNAFVQRVRQITETFIRLREDTERERRTMNQIWSKRLKQLDMVFESLTGVSGEIEAISSKSVLPGIETLEVCDDNHSQEEAA